MKIYTKGGDTGETSLFGGKRVPKDELRIEAYGTSDELNSFLGWLRTEIDDEKIIEDIIEIQDRIFTLGSHLAADPDKPKLKLPPLEEKDVEMLEKRIDQMDSELEPLQTFILPGGNQVTSLCHVCRTITRRCERRTVSLSKVADVNPLIIRYLNRLSDYLFVASRYLGMRSNANEIPWNPKM